MNTLSTLMGNPLTIIIVCTNKYEHIFAGVVETRAERGTFLMCCDKAAVAVAKSKQTFTITNGKF
jgi:hypothetical protein